MIRFAFFGTSDYSVITLATLKEAGLIPTLVVTTPDKPKGRGLALSSSPVKAWALEENIPVIQPDDLSNEDFIKKMREGDYDVFIVVSYGKIIPKALIDIPRHGALNIHPSLLPALRGSSPIETAILQDRKETGVTIILIDEKMDHGPIVAEEKMIVEPWPPHAGELGAKLVSAGSSLLARILPAWLERKISATDQDHEKATYTKKIEKADGLIDLTADGYKNFLKIQAYSAWPRAYFFHTRKNGQTVRVTIAEAEYKDAKLILLRVIPDGKKEMAYADFIRNY